MSVLNAVYPCGVPVLSIDERLFFLPPTGHAVHNRARKILFFYDVNCQHKIRELGDGSTLQLSGGDILILPHFCNQLYTSLSPGTTRVHALRLIIDPEIVPPLRPGDTESVFAPLSDGESIEDFARTQFNRVAHLKGGMTAEVREGLARLRRESEKTAGSHDFGYRFRAGAICTELMVLAARQIQSTRAHRVSHMRTESQRIEEVREFVVKHLDTPLSLNHIATHLGISPEHLSRVWKKATGITIFEYIRRTRIERAKSRLISSDANISQIAAACGFSSLALFSRTFKQESGLSPNQYRQRRMK